jgi:hypothetical protein
MKTKIILKCIKKVPNTVLGDLRRLIPGPVSTTIVRVAGESWTWDQCTLEVNLGNEDVLIPDLTARNLGENARVGSGISRKK